MCECVVVCVSVRAHACVRNVSCPDCLSMPNLPERIQTCVFAIVHVIDGCMHSASGIAMLDLIHHWSVQ